MATTTRGNYGRLVAHFRGGAGESREISIQQGDDDRTPFYQNDSLPHLY